MNKFEIAVVSLLFLLLLAWGVFYRAFFAQRPRDVPPLAVATNEAAQPSPQVAEPAPARTEPPQLAAPSVPETTAEAGEHVVRTEPEKTVVLRSDRAEVTVSSWGGGIVEATLVRYTQTADPKSGPVRLDFRNDPALSLSDLPGFSTNADFAVSVDSSCRTARVTRADASGLKMERLLSINGYRIDVTDRFSLPGDSSAPGSVPPHGVEVGPMSKMAGETAVKGMSYLGLNNLAASGGSTVQSWSGGQLDALFGQRSSVLSCVRPSAVGLKPAVVRRLDTPMSWVATKNKFFVQILKAEDASQDCEIRAARNMAQSNVLDIASVSAALIFPGKSLQPGEAWVRNLTYYVGPKEYASLKPLGSHQEDVMEFGWLKPLCTVLLGTLNALHRIIPNFGVAIILLTVLVRVLLWPVTHKSTESMKKMQKMQPLVAKIREKYKDKPQKMNQEIMALYKEHKVNPMAGCLPIAVQIPVFIALFNVLRSAVELRFAPFLWISDLSEPEGLLAGVLPIPLNILPLFMTAATIWQQKLTPATGDPQQQKMMMMMPVVMLFLFYNMASALVLYWSTSTVISVVQMMWQRRNATSQTTVAAPA